MKKVNIPRLLTVLFLAGTIVSCRDNPDSKKIAEEKNEKTLDTRSAERDAQFVVNEVAAGYAIVDWTSPIVKVNEHRELRDIAFRLQREHVRLIDKWKAYAEKKNILLPDSSVGNVKDRVKDFTDQNDDSLRYKFWVDEMLDQEKRFLARLEDFMDDAGDPALKLLLQDELPVIRMNRDQLMMLKSKL